APPPRERGPAADAPAPRPKDAMRLTGLSPAKPALDACSYRYPVGTTSPRAQAFVDQGLGLYYSYVYPEAARAFETALTHDPDCAYAWLMLQRSFEKWGRGTNAPKPGGFVAALGGPGFAALPEKVAKSPADYALGMAKTLHPKATHREQLLIQSRLQEKGLWPDTPPDARAKKARESLDELLTLYEDDQEGWFWRAQLAEGTNGKTPFYKALLRVNPDHPGANHELVHFYEIIKRPALGWPYAEGYIRSSPGIPHALHMQAHLAMRIGKWGPTTDWSSRAIELHRRHQEYQGVKPDDDLQFSHHLETLTRALVHDGRFYEANKIKAEAEGHKYQYRPEWFRLALAEADWDAAARQVAEFRRRGKADGAYYAALLWLERGRPDRAAAEVDTLRAAARAKTDDRALERRLWEAQGRMLCQTGDGEAGLKLLKRAVDATKNDYFHHSWGNGAVLMEAWGVGALEAGDAAQAEEAFQEALAHDAGSVRGALGLWAVCSRLGRADEAERYMSLARRCWSRADPSDFDRLRYDLASKAERIIPPGAAAAR
ncbi:MAG: tetratricopeptide repeat protein, partial [Gemmataceae bacterium]|nr:tetratricopeptide repeat protein [Gemmataceae bacterium]